jgi:hypothetical protein
MTIKSHYFPDKEFASKEELFNSMRENYKDFIAFKKADIQKSCFKGAEVTCRLVQPSKLKEANKALEVDDNYYYIVVNTTKILDSHDDLHIDGIWNKTVNEQQGQNFLVADHELKIDSVIVRKEHVYMMIAKLPFSALGKSYPGDTEALIYRVPKDKVIHQKAKEWLESGDEIQASVRMLYVNILFAMDSNDPADKELKSNYDTYIGQVANKDDFEYIPYFFPIKEAKNVKESSLVVYGSNHVTGNVLTPEPEKSTPVNNKQVRPAEEQATKINFYHTLIV